jgi:30S ribosomal protein S31
MGKGDRKSKRGKIFMGSHGISRPRNNKKVVVVKTAKPEKKEKPEKTIKIEKQVKIEKPVVEVTPEVVAVVETEKKPAKKPAVKKPKKESTETAE